MGRFPAISQQLLKAASARPGVLRRGRERRHRRRAVPGLELRGELFGATSVRARSAEALL